MSELTKTCTTCGETKLISKFWKGSSKSLGVQHRCTKCGKAYNKKFWASKAGRRTHLANKLKSSFGLSLGEYDSMLDAQGGVCLICGGTEGRKYRGVPTRLAVDHDHKTGKVRGLLCYRCNSVLAFVNDDVDLLQTHINYINKHKGA